MPLTVISFATYLTRPPFGSEDHRALKFIKAIKGRQFEKWAKVPVLGRLEKIDNSNLDDAIGWFGEIAAAEIAKLKLSKPIVFVPLPNSSSTVNNRKVPRTTRLASAIASRLPDAVVWDGLRWLKEEIPTHQEGTRRAELLYPNMAVTSTPPAKGTFVIVDDVYTQGGHLQAAAARLAGKTVRCKWAICAGRTVLESQEETFLTSHQELQDFTPRE